MWSHPGWEHREGERENENKNVHPKDQARMNSISRGAWTSRGTGRTAGEKRGDPGKGVIRKYFRKDRVVTSCYLCVASGESEACSVGIINCTLTFFGSSVKLREKFKDQLDLPQGFQMRRKHRNSPDFVFTSFPNSEFSLVSWAPCWLFLALCRFWTSVL